MPTAYFTRRTPDGQHQLLLRDLATGTDTPIGEPQPALFMLELLAERLEADHTPNPDRELAALEPTAAEWAKLRQAARDMPPSGGLD